MGCSNCGSGGCKNSGTCSSGGCNKLEVFDWLGNMTLPGNQPQYDILEIRFKNSRKGFYRNTDNSTYQVGDVVVVEGNPGLDVGVVSIVGELARIQVRKKAPGLKSADAKVIKRMATQEDIEKWMKARSLEKEVMYKSRVLAVNLGLEMKISDVEYQADLTKAVFYYTADGRIDFRQLIRDMADEFKIRIEMRQIGARQEASRLGGIGSCGRELCCSTWLTDFRSVSTSSARYQQLSLNPQKLAGQCGKLKCCLNYELDSYIDALKAFPKGDVKLKTQKGTAAHIKTDVFKEQMWYIYEGDAGVGSSMVPLKPERVREIIRMNRNGKEPIDLNDFIDLPEIEVEPDYTNVVGQDSLNRFEHIFNKKKKRKRSNSSNSRNNKKPRANQGDNKSNQDKPNDQESSKPKQGKPRPKRKPRPKADDSKPKTDKPVNQSTQGKADDKPRPKRKPQRKKRPQKPQNETPKNENK